MLDLGPDESGGVHRTPLRVLASGPLSRHSAGTANLEGDAAVLERVDGRNGDIGGTESAEVELTPIFHALALAAQRGAGDPYERFRRDPLAAPLPAAIRPTGASNPMMLRTVPDPAPESGSPAPVPDPRHASADGSDPSRPAGRARPARTAHAGSDAGSGAVGGAGPSGGGRHRSLRAVTPHGPVQGRSGSH